MNNEINLNFENVYEFIFDYVYSKFDMFGHLSPMKLITGNWWMNHEYKDGKYLFSWDNIQGNDDENLKKYLINKFRIRWVTEAEIKKNDDIKTIRITSETNFLLLTLNDKENTVGLEIDDGRTDIFIVKPENGERKIYKLNENQGGSWGPFIQWAFINEGVKRGYAVRADHTKPHIFYVANDFDKDFTLNGLPYGAINSNGKKNKFPAFNKIDVCWGDNENSFSNNAENMILALEFEDMDKVKAFGYDINSLLATNSRLRVIIVRILFPDNSDGMQLQKLEQILHEKCQDKSFGFIFIYPFDTTRIIFEGYEWAQNELKQLEMKYFEIETNEEYVVKK